LVSVFFFPKAFRSFGVFFWLALSVAHEVDLVLTVLCAIYAVF
jgi:hypothetical protein